MSDFAGDSFKSSLDHASKKRILVLEQQKQKQILAQSKNLPTSPTLEPIQQQQTLRPNNIPDRKPNESDTKSQKTSSILSAPLVVEATSSPGRNIIKLRSPKSPKSPNLNRNPTNPIPNTVDQIQEVEEENSTETDHERNRKRKRSNSVDDKEKKKRRLSDREKEKERDTEREKPKEKEKILQKDSEKERTREKERSSSSSSRVDKEKSSSSSSRSKHSSRRDSSRSRSQSLSPTNENTQVSNVPNSISVKPEKESHRSSHHSSHHHSRTSSSSHRSSRKHERSSHSGSRSPSPSPRSGNTKSGVSPNQSLSTSQNSFASPSSSTTPQPETPRNGQIKKENTSSSSNNVAAPGKDFMSMGIDAKHRGDAWKLKGDYEKSAWEYVRSGLYYITFAAELKKNQSPARFVQFAQQTGDFFLTPHFNSLNLNPLKTGKPLGLMFMISAFFHVSILKHFASSTRLDPKSDITLKKFVQQNKAKYDPTSMAQLKASPPINNSTTASPSITASPNNPLGALNLENMDAMYSNNMFKAFSLAMSSIQMNEAMKYAKVYFQMAECTFESNYLFGGMEEMTKYLADELEKYESGNQNNEKEKNSSNS